MKRMILTLAAVLLTSAAADAKCRNGRSRSVATNRVVTVQTTPAAKPAPKVEPKAAAPVAAPTTLTSGCASGNCRTAVTSRFRLFAR